MSPKKKQAPTPKESRLKRFAKTITKIGNLVRGRSYKKVEAYTNIPVERLKAIKRGSVEPDRGEISKLTSFSWEKEKAKEKALEKELNQERKTKSTGKITPGQLSKYVGFSTKIIRNRMHPKLSSDQLEKAYRIPTLQRVDGKYVTGVRKNRQVVYYYVRISINQEKELPDSFGHGFMSEQNAKQFLKDGDVAHIIHQNEDGYIYTEVIYIFNVLTFPHLAKSYKAQKLLDWSTVPEATIEVSRR